MDITLAGIKYDEYGRENESSHRRCLENQVDSEILVKIELFLKNCISGRTSSSQELDALD